MPLRSLRSKSARTKSKQVMKIRRMVDNVNGRRHCFSGKMEAMTRRKKSTIKQNVLTFREERQNHVNYYFISLSAIATNDPSCSSGGFECSRAAFCYPKIPIKINENQQLHDAICSLSKWHHDLWFWLGTSIIALCVRLYICHPHSKCTQSQVRTARLVILTHRLRRSADKLD